MHSQAASFGRAPASAVRFAAFRIYRRTAALFQELVLSLMRDGLQKDASDVPLSEGLNGAPRFVHRSGSFGASRVTRPVRAFRTLKRKAKTG